MTMQTFYTTLTGAGHPTSDYWQRLRAVARAGIRRLADDGPGWFFWQ